MVGWTSEDIKRCLCYGRLYYVKKAGESLCGPHVMHRVRRKKDVLYVEKKAERITMKQIEFDSNAEIKDGNLVFYTQADQTTTILDGNFLISKK